MLLYTLYRYATSDLRNASWVMGCDIRLSKDSQGHDMAVPVSMMQSASSVLTCLRALFLSLSVMCTSLRAECIYRAFFLVIKPEVA